MELSVPDYGGEGRDSPDAVERLTSWVRIEWLGTRHHVHWDHPAEVAARILELA